MSSAKQNVSMQSHTTPEPPSTLTSFLRATKHRHLQLISAGQSGLGLIECQYKCVIHPISLFSASLIFLSPVTSSLAPRAGSVTAAIIHQPLICCFDNDAGWRGQTNMFWRLRVRPRPLASYPRWMVRMCLWMPAAVLSTLPQFFHRHLNITFMEFCGKHARAQQLRVKE